MTSKSKIAVFPGSFDPITNGHVDIVKRALPLFDIIYIAIGENSQKNSLFTIKQRMDWIKLIFKEEQQINVVSFQGLTSKFCESIQARFIIRGIRNASDFDYEKTISQINQTLVKNLETLFFISHAEYAHISSTIVRELILGKAELSGFIPKEVISNL